jgi:hypothetical protein
MSVLPWSGLFVSAPALCWHASADRPAKEMRIVAAYGNAGLERRLAERNE